MTKLHNDNVMKDHESRMGDNNLPRVTTTGTSNIASLRLSHENVFRCFVSNDSERLFERQDWDRRQKLPCLRGYRATQLTGFVCRSWGTAPLPKMSSPGWTGAEEIESLRTVGEVGGSWILADDYRTANNGRVCIYRRNDDATAEMISLDTANGRRIVVHRTKKESILMTSEGSGKTTRYLLCKRKESDT